MTTAKVSYTFDRVVRLILTAGFLAGIIWLLGYLSDVLIPFAIAFLLAYIINPLVLLVRKKIPNHLAAVLIVLASLLILLVIFSVIFVPMIGHEIERMGKITYNLLHNANLNQRAASFLPEGFWQNVQAYLKEMDTQNFFKAESLWKVSEAVFKKILPGVWGVVTGAASFLFGLLGLFVIVLYLVFLLLDYQKIREKWQTLIPQVYRKTVTEFVSDFDSGMRRYFRAQILVALIVGLLFALGFGLIGLPLGLLLGLFIGVLNIVPYLQVVGLIPAFSLAFVHALDKGYSLWIVFGLTGLVFVVVQIIQDTLLVPKIMGKATGLSPAIILLSLSVWGKLLGILGLLIALPMTCLLFAYYQRFLSSKI